MTSSPHTNESRDIEAAAETILSMKQGLPIPTGSSTPSVHLMGDEFRAQCIQLIEPALVQDVKSMIRGRVAWRVTSVVMETLGKLMGGAATILAFASSSELTGDVSKTLSFTAGSMGTASMISMSLATFSRTQALERSKSINLILEQAKFQHKMPDITETLAVDDSSPSSSK